MYVYVSNVGSRVGVMESPSWRHNEGGFSYNGSGNMFVCT